MHYVRMHVHTDVPCGSERGYAHSVSDKEDDVFGLPCVEGLDCPDRILQFQTIQIVPIISVYRKKGEMSSFIHDR